MVLPEAHTLTDLPLVSRALSDVCGTQPVPNPHLLVLSAQQERVDQQRSEPKSSQCPCDQMRRRLFAAAVRRRCL